MTAWMFWEPRFTTGHDSVGRQASEAMSIKIDQEALRGVVEKVMADLGRPVVRTSDSQAGKKLIKGDRHFHRESVDVIPSPLRGPATLESSIA